MMKQRHGFYQWWSIWKDHIKYGNDGTFTRAQEVFDEGADIGMAVVDLDRNTLIPAALFKNMRDNLLDARAIGLPVIVKFRYGEEVDDATTERIVEHIKQLNPLLHQFSDVILTLQAGFIGYWGEWHSSVNNNSREARRAVATALFANTPKDMVISFRTPQIIREDVFPLPPQDAPRVGFHHDAIWSGDDIREMGTYSLDPSMKAQEQSFLRNNCAVFGGETASLSETNKSPDLIRDGMCRIPVTYLSKDWHETVAPYWDDHNMRDEIRQQLASNAIFMGAL